MKNLAKLAIFFSLSFAILFLTASGIKFLSLWIEWVRTLPVKNETILTLIIAAAHWSLPFTLYGSVLLSLSYAFRKQYFALMIVPCLLILSFAAVFGISTALKHWKFVTPAVVSGKALGEKGLILSNSLNKNETTIVLLNGAADPTGPRVVAVPDQDMLFLPSAPLQSDIVSFNLPPIPFEDDTPWLLKSISTDLRIVSENFKQKFDAGFFPFLIYCGSLIFLLVSLGFTQKISAWPLVNLFLGILAFRGILALEVFFNSLEMQYVFSSFLNNILPVSLAVPIIFTGFGILVNIYGILVYISKKRRHADE